MTDKIFRIFILSLLLTVVGVQRATGCTSGLFGASATRDGRPLLWKHRDTSAVDNKVEYIPASDGCFGYVGLFNASDRDCQEVWAGFNSAGLAIMNTASYNIKDDNVAEKDMDREGLIMTMALKNCATVEDFSQLLDTLPRPMGVEANFGVFDAYGNGAYFETNNHSYVRFDLASSPNDCIIRTNYSHSGRKNEGYGYIREANANHLLAQAIDDGCVSPELLTEQVSRSFYHDIFKADLLQDGSIDWAIDQDFIPRYKSSAVIVIEGLPAGDTNTSPSEGYVMWTGLGYPPCAEIYPVECKPDGISPCLRGLCADGHSELSDIAKKRRDDVFSRHYDNGDKYIDLRKLQNEEATGYLQVLVPLNLESYDRYRRNHRRDK